MGEDEVVADAGELGGFPASDGAGEAGDAGCEETVRRLYYFLDGALTEERRVAIRAHLDSCGDCFEALGFETELRRVIADHCRERVPEALKDRIAEAIRREAAAQAGTEPA